MAISHIKHMAYTPGQMLDFVRQFFYAYVATADVSGLVYSITLTTANGLRAVVMLVTEDGTPRYDWTVTLAGLDSGAQAPSDWFVSSPGFNGALTSKFWPSGVYPAPSWTALMEDWLSFVVSTKAEIIDSWSTGTSGTVHSASSSFASGNAHSGSGIFTVSDNRPGGCVELLSATLFAVTGDIYEDDPMAAPGVSGNACLSPSGDSGVAAAILSLGSIDTTISLNQGQVVYSIKNREAMT